MDRARDPRIASAAWFRRACCTASSIRSSFIMSSSDSDGDVPLAQRALKVATKPEPVTAKPAGPPPVAQTGSDEVSSSDDDVPLQQRKQRKRGWLRALCLWHCDERSNGTQHRRPGCCCLSPPPPPRATRQPPGHTTNSPTLRRAPLLLAPHCLPPLLQRSSRRRSQQRPRRRLRPKRRR